MSEDLIKRSDAIEVAYQLRRKPNDDEWDWWLRSFNAIPSADRPSGEVDAVKEYEHQVHNLEQGYITLGEFDKRIEPLRHLHYDRPQGEWIPSDWFDEWYGRTCECSVCGNEFLRFNFCPNCGADMRERESE